MIDLPENELMLRARAGDTEAESELVSHLANGMHIHSDTGNVSDARQAARIGAWHAIHQHSGRNGCSLSTYAWWLANGIARRERANAGPPQEDVVLSPVDPEREVAVKELAVRVKELVSRCTEIDALDRAIIERRILNQRSTFQALANMHGVARQTVADREKKLLSATLPRILAPLRSAI